MKTLIFGYGQTKVWVLFVLLSIFVAGCKDNNTSQSVEDATVLGLIESNPDLEIFSNLIKGTSLTTTLSESGPMTVFAPSDNALAQLPEGYLESLTTEQMLDILRYHIYSNEYPVINEVKKEAINSMHGDQLFLEIGQTSGNRINSDVQFVSTNIEADNGIIHIIDSLLMPDTYGTLADNIKKRYDYRTLYNRMLQTGLTDMLNEPGNKTLLASPDFALDRLELDMDVTLTQEEWREIMQYHILDQDITGAGPDTRTPLATMSGDSVYLTISQTNEFAFNNKGTISGLINSTNGKILFVPSAMLPDKFIDVLTVIDKRHNLRIISGAFYTTRLGQFLHISVNTEDVTIFVPKDAPELENWASLSETELSEILQYHMVNSRLTADQLQDGQTYSTWQGETITIQRNGDLITINGTATITLADLEARNGVVHVIDGALTPPVN